MITPGEPKQQISPALQGYDGNPEEKSRTKNQDREQSFLVLRQTLKGPGNNPS